MNTSEKWYNKQRYIRYNNVNQYFVIKQNNPNSEEDFQEDQELIIVITNYKDDRTRLVIILLVFKINSVNKFQSDKSSSNF